MNEQRNKEQDRSQCYYLGMMNKVSATLIAVRLDDSRFGSGPATVVAFPTSVDEYNALVIDRDGARDPRMRLWCIGNGRAHTGMRVVAGLVCGTGLADIRPEEG